MSQLNIIGPRVIKLRVERGWSQDVLAARLQCQEDDISRDVLANIETGRTRVTDAHLRAFQKVFAVRIVMLFPKAVQELDEKFSSPESTKAPKIQRRRQRYN